MNIAYLISAHTDPAQLSRLTAALRQEGTHFFVHIDRKSPIAPFRALLDEDDTHLLTNRIDVRWGTINEWDYQLALLRAAVAFPLPFDRLVTLSGLDYPLWSNARIVAHFRQCQGKEILAAMPLLEAVKPKDIFRQVRPYTTIPLIGNRGNQLLGIALRKLLMALGIRHGYTLRVGWETWREYKGAAWWAISEGLARHAIATYDAHRRQIRRFFRHQHCPAETLLPTIAFNSPQWQPMCREFPCDKTTTLASMTLLHRIDYTTSVRIWEEVDFPLLVASGKMFARKLTTARSLSLISLIDKSRAAQ